MIAQSDWWDADTGKAHTLVFDHVRALDRTQFEIFNRFKQLESLYDTNPKPGGRYLRPVRAPGRMHENVISSNVDTVCAQIATTDVRAVFDTDDADWSTWRRARRLELYVEQLGKIHKILAKCRRAFKGAAMKGTGVVKVWKDTFKRLRIEAVMADDIVVDELEARDGEPKQLHHRSFVERAELKALHPKYAAQIGRAQGAGSGGGSWTHWAGWRPLRRNDLVVIESWRLPIGVKDAEGYVPGRYTKCIDGLTIVDEPYHKSYYPFAVLCWEPPINGWYGIGLAERISGVQLALNRRNLQMERKLDHGAFPTTWVQRQDAALAQTTATAQQNLLGTVAVYNGTQPPRTETPPPIHPEELQDAERLSSKASQISGVSRMAAQSVKPAGIETGVALREYRDQTTQRFATQEGGFEAFVLDVNWLVVDTCKDLGADAPKVVRKSRFGSREIAWGQVDMQEVRYWISAAPTLSRTRSGRLQLLMDLAAQGIISQDAAARAIGHPDIAREESLFNAAMENVEHFLEEIAEGRIMTPEPFMNLKLLVHRAQQQYLEWSTIPNVPEEVLSNLWDATVQAAWLVGNDNVGPDQSMPVGGPEAPGAPALGPGANWQFSPTPQPPGMMPQVPAAPAGIPPVAA